VIHSRAQQGHHRPKTPAPRLSAYNANGTSGARGRSAPSRPNWRRRCADCAYQSTNGCEPAEPPGKPAALPQAGGLWLRQRRPSGREFGAPTGHGHQDPAAGRQPAGRGNLLPASHGLGDAAALYAFVASLALEYSPASAISGGQSYQALGRVTDGESATKDNKTIDAVIKLLDVGGITHEDLRAAPVAQLINPGNLPGEWHAFANAEVQKRVEPTRP